MRKVYFVILTWNSEKVIGDCIHSILAFQSVIAHIYVVDNGSTDGTLKFVKKQENKRGHTISVIQLEKNLGIHMQGNQFCWGRMMSAPIFDPPKGRAK